MKEYLSYLDHKIQIPTELYKFFESKEVKLYKPNEIVYRQGEKAEKFYFLKSGNVEVFVHSAEGSKKALTNYSSGDVFGEASFFDGYPRISTAITLNQCEIVTINREDILQVFKDQPLLALQFIEQLSKKVRKLSREIDRLSFFSAEKRIAEYLLNRSNQNEVINCTQDDIGNAVGVSRVTVSRTLSKFSDKNWIKRGYKKIYLLDVKALIDFLEK